MTVTFEPRDLWVGVFWDRRRYIGGGTALHVFVCPVPCIVFHFVRAK